MTPVDEIDAVRRLIDGLADGADPRLIRRYALWHPIGQARTPYRRFRKLVGRMLRYLRLRPRRPIEPWRAKLKHADAGLPERVFLIWAVESGLPDIREACCGIEKMLESKRGWTPVLATDIADFAFYARLGWLVEYVPDLGPPATAYCIRKQRYLAWFYRGLPVLPIRAGLCPDDDLEELLLG